MSQFALITGASSGIGKALAWQFARDNYDLALVAEDGNGLDRTVQELSKEFPNIQLISIVKDLTLEASPQEIFDELSGLGIAVDVLVNDAGVGQRGMFAENALEKEIYIIRLNIEALTRLTKIFLRDMLSRDGGKILNLGSIAGFQPGPLLAVYHASKAYVVSFSEALAEELKDHPVTVTCLCPGATDTNFFERAEMENTQIVQSGKLMDPNEVAEAAYRGLMNGERIVIPGASNKVLTFMRRVMPQSLQAKLNKKFYETSEEQVSNL